MEKIAEVKAGDAALIEEIVRMERRIFPKHESLASSFQNEVSRRKCTLLYRYSENGGSIVVVGYVMIFWASSLVATISKLAVKESFRRQGHAEALMRAALERCQARRIQCVNLHVDPCRTSAMALYQKLGFKSDAFVEAYYAPGRDAHRMVLDF